MMIAQFLDLAHYELLMTDINSTPDQTTVDNQPDRCIFLCHAKEDVEYVRSLYKQLIGQGYPAWLDDIDLLPGQPWEYEIRKTIRKSDIVIIVLSKVSANKRGFVQREIGMALDIVDELPEGQDFIFPILTEVMDIPERLKKYHAFRAYDKNEDIAKLFKAIDNVFGNKR